MRIAAKQQVIARLNRRSAFTLLEVLVVVAILVVLASVASIYVFRYLDDSKISKAKLDCKNLQKASESYMLKYSEPPQQIINLVQPPDGDPFVDGISATKDPWGRDYQINVIESSNGNPIIEVWTPAPDGKRISSRAEMSQVK